MDSRYVEFVRMTRAALAATGFVRHSADGLVWFESGAGAPVVLVHGANDQAGTWAAVARSLAERHHVIVPDLAGHGESDPQTGPLPVPLIVGKLHAVISHALARPERADARSASGRATSEGSRSPGLTLIGNSMGAWISLLYTLAYPADVARLVLESGGGLALPLAVPLVATNREEAMTILRAAHGPHAILPEWSVDALLARSTDSPMLRLTEVAENFVDTRLGELRVPTTILRGEYDGIVSQSYVETLRDGIAGAELHVIEGAAHIPHAQQPERFLACLPAIS